MVSSEVRRKAVPSKFQLFMLLFLASVHAPSVQVDDVIKQAQATSASLAQQRAVLGGAFSRLGTISSRIPGVSSS